VSKKEKEEHLMTKDIEATQDKYICAFVDILGARKRGNELDLAIKMDKYYDHVVSKNFSFEEDNEDILIRSISDGIIFAKKIGDNFLRASLDIITFMAKLSKWALFYTESLIRGGIAQGSLYIGKHIVFGEALIKAYEIESKEAVYTRIVIEEEIIKEIKRRNCDSANSDLELFTRTDFDGRIYVVLLYDFMWEDDSNSFSKLESIFYKITKNIKDPYIIQKYSWWANVINKELEKNDKKERLRML
jgi:hypothetical protein